MGSSKLTVSRIALRSRPPSMSKGIPAKRPGSRPASAEVGASLLRQAPARSSSRKSALLEVRSREVPVHEVAEPCLDELRAQVAVVDVVRVLPDVAGDQALRAGLH